ncbi:MAG: hypothetical protein K0S45_2080 [Nitrospira sp.]|jgi:hypothetical protein|nr:hypothetical protein [Nitrospira sp.]
MNVSLVRNALFYPFHLCAPLTLERLLARYRSIHFRDYMALRLTPLMGTMAYQDRMGDGHPTLVTTGRLVQGYNVSGPLDPAAVASVNRDLDDSGWRALFHEAIRSDRRFQRGLFDLTHAVRIGSTLVPGPAALLRLLEPERAGRPWSVALVQSLAGPALALDEAYHFEYGLALLKTAAAHCHTIRLAQEHDLVATTDSPTHHALLSRTLAREHMDLANELLSVPAESPPHLSESHG